MNSLTLPSLGRNCLAPCWALGGGDEPWVCQLFRALKQDSLKICNHFLRRLVTVFGKLVTSFRYFVTTMFTKLVTMFKKLNLDYLVTVFRHWVSTFRIWSHYCLKLPTISKSLCCNCPLWSKFPEICAHGNQECFRCFWLRETDSRFVLSFHPQNGSFYTPKTLRFKG